MKSRKDRAIEFVVIGAISVIVLLIVYPFFTRVHRVFCGNNQPPLKMMEMLTGVDFPEDTKILGCYLAPVGYGGRTLKAVFEFDREELDIWLSKMTTRPGGSEIKAERDEKNCRGWWNPETAENGNRITAYPVTKIDGKIMTVPVYMLITGDNKHHAIVYMKWTGDFPTP